MVKLEIEHTMTEFQGKKTFLEVEAFYARYL